MRYWLDFILFPIVALVAVAIYEPKWHLLAGVPLGFIAWTLFEYAAHRAIHKFAPVEHGKHHADPAELVTYNWYVSPALFAGFFIAFWFLGVTFIFAGFIGGYVWFMWLHRTAHHWPAILDPIFISGAGWFGFALRPVAAWLRRYQERHDLHHKQASFNYGVSVYWWDKLLGTYRAPGAS